MGRARVVKISQKERQSSMIAKPIYQHLLSPAGQPGHLSNSTFAPYYPKHGVVIASVNLAKWLNVEIPY